VRAGLDYSEAVRLFALSDVTGALIDILPKHVIFQSSWRLSKLDLTSTSGQRSRHLVPVAGGAYPSRGLSQASRGPSIILIWKVYDKVPRVGLQEGIRH
jgi:hypothetical protein